MIFDAAASICASLVIPKTGGAAPKPGETREGLPLSDRNCQPPFTIAVNLNLREPLYHRIGFAQC